MIDDWDSKYESSQKLLWDLIRGFNTTQRLKALDGLARIYVHLDKESPEAQAISSFSGYICHLCGEICRTSVDEEHDEEYIVCSGGSKLLLPDGRMLESEDDMKDLYWSKPNDCSNIGDWSEGIDYFVEKLND